MNLHYQQGNLITLAQAGNFDVIVHGCNCFCRMKRGIAPQMANAFGCDKFLKEGTAFIGDKSKLGTVDYQVVTIFENQKLVVVNAYTQYHWEQPSNDGFPLSYNALRSCFKQINKTFSEKTVGIPKIGAGLAGGDWPLIEAIIKEESADLKALVIVEFEPKTS